MSAPGTPATDQWGDRLPRRLGLWSAVAVLVGSTIGSGIFRTPAIIAARVPAPGPMFAVWILGGVLALCGALSYAELAAMYPRSGGVYVYIREGFGRLPAFLFGWTELVLIRASALGAIATPFAEYLLRSLGYNPALEPYATTVHWVNAAYLYLLPIDRMAKSPLVAADAAQLIVGQIGVGLVAVVVMVATFSTLLGSILTSPRIFFAMAEDGLLFKPVARVHPRFHTPSVAIVGTAVLGVVFVLLRTFEQLADQFVVAIFPFYALAAAAVIVLRRRQPDRPRPVRVWGYPAVPVLFVLASFLILGNALREHPGPTGLAFGIILLGIHVY